ncbi:MAG: sugar phosphate isomerase/epimerase family protein [Nocardioidaceae bacterium]
MDLQSPRDVGLAPLTVGRPDPLTMVDAAQAGGFGSLGMTLWAPDEDCAPVCRDRRLREEVRRRVEDTGLPVSDVGVVVLRPRVDMAIVERVLVTARALGARQIIVMNADDDRHRAVATLRAVADLAGSYEQRVGVEFMPYSSTRTVADGLRLAEDTEADNVGLVLDVLHLFRSGGTAADLREPLLRALHLVQICDAERVSPAPDQLRAEALGGRLHPGEGELPLDRVLALLPDDVPVTLEAPTAGDAAHSPLQRGARAGAAMRRFLSAP